MQPAAQMLLVLALCAGLAACAAQMQIGMMTPEVSVSQSRPQLTPEQAAMFTRQRVLAGSGSGEQAWDPLADQWITSSAAPPLHYRVDRAAANGLSVFGSVQAAVNQAHADVAAGKLKASRVIIGIAAGDYQELVYVPAGAVPITMWGLGSEPGQVRIHYAIDAAMPAADYRAQQARVYEAEGMHPDIAAFFRACSLAQPSIGTGCTAVLWSRRDGLQLRNITVANSYDQSRGGGPRQPTGLHQAVAMKSEGADRLHLDRVQLLGHQDTLFLAGPPSPSPSLSPSPSSSTLPTPGSTRSPEAVQPAPRAIRSFIHRSLVAGDVDFIFGPTTAYFLSSEIRFVGGYRNSASGYIAAPSTSLHTAYGFVFEDCDFTAEGGGQLVEQRAVYLARQWFTGARCSPYGTAAKSCSITGKDSVQKTGAGRPVGSGDDGSISPQTLETVGKMVVLRSRLGPHLRTDTPWSPWQADRSARNHRPAQYSSDDFWRNLHAAGHDPAALGYARPEPPEPYLAEFRNSGPSALAAARR